MVKAKHDKLEFFEHLVGLSVDLHNLNLSVQRQHDISIVQWLVLKKIVDRPGLSAGTLATISGVHPSTLTPTISRLEAMGLIYIQERSSDLRRRLLLGSWKGLEYSRKREAAFTRALTELDQLGPAKAEFERMRVLTQSLQDYLQRFG